MMWLNVRIAMVSQGVYSHHKFSAIEQQQMAYLKNQNRSLIFTCPLPNLPLTQLGDEPLFPREDPTQFSIMALSLIPIRME